MNPAGSTFATIVVLILCLVGLIFFFSGLRRRYQLVRLGRAENRFDHILERTKGLVLFVFGQWGLLKNINRTDRAGITHLFIFWGMIFFVFSYFLTVFATAFSENAPLITAGRTPYKVLCSITDILGIMALISLIWGAIRRFVIRPARQTISGAWAYFMGTLGILIIAYFLVEAFQIVAGVEVSVLQCPMGWLLAYALKAGGMTNAGAQVGYVTSWWLSIAVIFGFLVHSRYSKHMHAIAIPINVFFRSLYSKGVLRPIDLKTARTFTVSSIDRLTWKQLLDCYACTECGWCQINCPAYLSGKRLNPKELMLSVKEILTNGGPIGLKGGKAGHRNIVGEVVSEDTLWQCTACGACEHQCPAMNEQMHLVIDLRRHLVEQGNLSANVARVLESLRMLGNPWEQPQSSRMDWSEGRRVNLIQRQEEVEVLYWIGCASAYDHRAKEILRATLGILDKAHVSYAVLGTEEVCCGDIARRMGEEGLFHLLAQSNIKTLSRYRFNCILTHCPHCFNTLKNEYAQLGANFAVVHHSEFLLKLIHAGRIKLRETSETRITYQDPCYLGRCNGIFDAPRQVLHSIPRTEIIEMELYRERALCCGAGGGQFWIQAEGGRRIEEVRLEQAHKVNPEVIATACPYCTIMLDAAALTSGTGEKVRDIAELVAQAAV